MPGLNTGSMSDISFLLTFFLLTSSITTDKGIQRRLPPVSKDAKIPDVNRRNVLRIWSICTINYYERRG